MQKSGFETRRMLDVFERLLILTGMVVVGGRPLSGEVSERTGRARLCAHVKILTLNSAIDQQLLDRRVEGRANAIGSA